MSACEFCGARVRLGDSHDAECPRAEAECRSCGNATGQVNDADRCRSCERDYDLAAQEDAGGKPGEVLTMGAEADKEGGREGEGDCEACGEHAALVRVHGAGTYCGPCAADHPLTIERSRADDNEEG